MNPKVAAMNPKITSRMTEASAASLAQYQTENQRWEAVLGRDGAADHVFFYGVRSTKIYCRPSCPSWRPGREQVSFYPSPEAAESAGFQACRRCHPRETAVNAEAVLRVCRFIEEHLDEALVLDDLSEMAGLSPQHFQRTFKRIVGVTPREYADACRLDRFKSSLKAGDTITEAMLEAGYGSTSRLYERTPGQLGMTPTAYRRGGQKIEISYTTADTPLGRMLVAATEKGVCTVSLGDSDTILAAALQQEYPVARIERDNGDLQRWVDMLVQHVAGKRLDSALPLDVQATAFQRRVWQELRAIPYGGTRSYRQIAEAIGNPNASRAVAQACASNPVGLAVPCHRVVRGDGGLGGYRWGEDRKQALLAREKAEIERQ